MKKPNVINRGNGSIIINKGGKFFMHGASGEEIGDNVKIYNSGEIVSNDLNITNNAKIFNQGLVSSNKITIGFNKIENWASKHPWLFLVIGTILGYFFNKIMDNLLM